MTDPISQGTTYYVRVSADQTYWTEAISFSTFLDIHPYPNPFRVSEGHTNITFTNLLQNSEITITTISGKLVCREDGIGPDDWAWDVTNKNGDKIAPGVYLYSVKYPLGSMNGKFLVIR